MTRPDWQDGEVVSFAAPLWILAGVVLVFAIVGVTSTLNSLSPPPPCRCDCCACDAGPPPDPIDEYSTIVVPSPFPEKQ